MAGKIRYTSYRQPQIICRSYIDMDGPCYVYDRYWLEMKGIIDSDKELYSRSRLILE